MASRLTHLAQDIKLSHSVFALPFAFLAAFMAAVSEHPVGRGKGANSLAFEGLLPSGVELVLILICMACARTVAMLANRLVDARLDALNPRTAGRALPSGRLSRRYMIVTTWACAIAFIVATAGFLWLGDNPFPLMLSPLVLAWIAGYSYTKRFTWLCHLFLGSALALSPIAAAIAIQPAYIVSAQPWLLALMVLCWVAGFDIIYALQDVVVDRQTGVYSMPANLGVEPALWGSRVLHVVALAMLVSLWMASPMLDAGFAVAVAIVAGLLIIEHALVWVSQTHHIHMAFFTLNGIISLLLGGLGIIDVVLYTT